MVMAPRRNFPGPTFATAGGELRPVPLVRAGLVVLLASLPLVCGAGPAEEQDTRLTFEARRALFEDPALAPYNVGVRVQDRVATLWGAVPSAAHARRAVGRVRSLPRLTGVRSELRVDPDLKPPRRDVESRPEPSRAGPRRPLTLVGGSVPLPPARVSSREVSPKPRPAEDRPANGKRVLVLPAFVVGEGPPPLERSINRLRRELRFQGLFVAVDRGVVYLRGPTSRAEALFELAQIISRMPGVERVVVKDDPAPPRR